MADNASHGVNRRKVLASLGAVVGASLAGCGQQQDQQQQDQDQDQDQQQDQQQQQELGERVGTVTGEFWAGIAPVWEDATPILQDNLEQVGINFEAGPVDFQAQINNVIEDKRTHSIAMWLHGLGADRLDPHEFTRRFSIDWAGGNGQANPANYANCEYTANAIAQSQAGDPDRRREFVNNAHQIMSEELVTCPVTRLVFVAIGRESSIEFNGTGAAGFQDANPTGYIKSTPVGDDTLLIPNTATLIETTNWPINDNSPDSLTWAQLPNSPLTAYNGEYEVENVLAESIEVENGFRTVTVSLREATAHNGDEFTAEDVQFTFKQLWDHPGAYPQASSPEYDSIDVIDDRTVQFNFPDPYPPLTTREFPRWGILHKNSWVEAGAQEDPEAVTFEEDEIIGYGPFQVETLQTGQSWTLTPHDGHPVYSPDHNITFQIFNDQQAQINAFRAGEIDVIGGLTPKQGQRVKDGVDDPIVETVTQGFLAYLFYFQYQLAPTKFREFRDAVGTAINRKQIIDVAYLGQTDPPLKSCPLMDTHPWRPPEDMLTAFTDSPTGDTDAARQKLADAGWGWDNNDRLRYPADADLGALWPAESVPQPDQFECVDSEGNYDGEVPS